MFDGIHSLCFTIGMCLNFYAVEGSFSKPVKSKRVRLSGSKLSGSKLSVSKLSGSVKLSVSGQAGRASTVQNV